LLGFILKIALGINSPVMSIMRVEMTVCRIRIMNPVGMAGTNQAMIIGSRILAIAIPYTTRAILFPKSNAPRTLEGSLKKTDRIFAEKRPLFLSSSILSLFELTKAISNPEKKAEKIRDIMTIVQLFIPPCIVTVHQD
jgi:hypothetical protein